MDKMQRGTLNFDLNKNLLARKCRYFIYKGFVANRFVKKFKAEMPHCIYCFDAAIDKKSKPLEFNIF